MAHALHLGYHYVRDGSAPGPNCPPERLRRQIASLLADGYEILTCGEVGRRMLMERPLPERVATLSFDDGLRDQYTTAFPILRELGVPATFFYITCALDLKLPPVIGFQILIAELGAERIEREILPMTFKGTPYADLLDPQRYDASDRKMGEPPELRRIKWMFNHFPSQGFKQEKLGEIFAEHLGEGSQERFAGAWFMSGRELTEMHRAGVEIASHTVTHPALDITGLAEIEHELASSQQRLSETLSRAAINTFAWTFGGQFRPAAKRIAARYYGSAWNFLAGLKAMPDPPYDRFDIPRLNEAVLDPT